MLIGLKSNFNNKTMKNDIQDICKSFNLEYFEFKDKQCGSPLNINLPFTKFLNEIYPKIDVIIERKNTLTINNIISYCSIL